MKESLSSFYESNEFMELLSSYEDMVQNGGSYYFDGIDISDIAGYYSSMGDDDKAMEAVQFGLSLHPGDTDILIAKGQVLLHQGKSGEARDIADSINDDNNRELLFLKGSIELFDDNVKSADNYFWQSVLAGDDDPGLYCDIISLMTDYAQYDTAQNWLDKALVLEPEYKDFIEQQADLYFATQNFQKAADTYNKLIDHYPYDTYYWEQLVYIAYHEEDWQGALEDFEYIEAIDPMYNSMRMIKVECLIETDHFEEAEKVLRQLLSENPNSADVLFMLGNALSLMQRHEEAIECILNAIKLDDDDKQMYVQLSGEFFECGRYKESAESLTEAFRAGIITDAYAIRKLMIPLLERDEISVIYQMLKALMDIENLDYNEYELFLPALTMCCWQMGEIKDFKKYFSKAYRANPERTLKLFGITDITTDEETAVEVLVRVCENETINK